jgi:hypothetical protein
MPKNCGCAACTADSDMLCADAQSRLSATPQYTLVFVRHEDDDAHRHAFDANNDVHARITAKAYLYDQGLSDDGRRTSLFLFRPGERNCF